MQPTKIYEYLCLARGRILDWVRPLSEADYRREFGIGPGSIAKTLTHVVVSESYYVHRIAGNREARPGPPLLNDEAPPGFGELESTWARQAEQTKAVIAAVRDWDAVIEYRMKWDDGREFIARASPSDVFSQLAFHEVHHRAQVMNMLKRLGTVAEDLDYNTLMYVRPATA